MQKSDVPHQTKAIHVFDMVKFICALLVIAIHTAPLEPYSAIADFYLCDVLARIAVPVFFGIAGFLFAQKLNLLRAIQRILLLYLGWSMVYLVIQIPQWYHSGWWGIHVIKDYLSALILKGSYYHLWYLLATFYAYPLLYGALKKFSSAGIWITVAVLWMGECLTYSYSWLWIDKIDSICFLLEQFSGIFDGVFRALPLMLVGILSGKYAHTRSQNDWGIRALVSFVFVALEASVLYFFTPNSEKYSYLVATPFFTYYAICYLLRSSFQFREPNLAKHLRNSSLVIYCSHPFVDFAINKLSWGHGIIRWITVTVISTGGALLYSKMSMKHRALRSAVKGSD